MKRGHLDGERVVQAFLAAHFSLIGHYAIHSERGGAVPPPPASTPVSTGTGTGSW